MSKKGDKLIIWKNITFAESLFSSRGQKPNGVTYSNTIPSITLIFLLIFGTLTFIVEFKSQIVEARNEQIVEIKLF